MGGGGVRTTSPPPLFQYNELSPAKPLIPSIAPASRTRKGRCLLSSNTSLWGGGGSEVKRQVCVPKIDLQYRAPLITFIFFLREKFLMWVGGGGGIRRRSPGCHSTPSAPPPSGNGKPCPADGALEGRLSIGVPTLFGGGPPAPVPPLVCPRPAPLALPPPCTGLGNSQPTAIKAFYGMTLLYFSIFQIILVSFGVFFVFEQV